MIRRCSKRCPRYLLALVERGGHPVKIPEIRLQDFRRETVLFHELLIGMAAGAELWRPEPKGSCPLVRNIVRSMAIRTYRGIHISVLQEDFTVDAPGVLPVHLLVAPGTGLGDSRLGNARTRHVVSSMAINAERSPQVPLGEDGVVDTVQAFCVVVEVTPLAAFIIGQCKLAQILERSRWMGKG